MQLYVITGPGGTKVGCAKDAKARFKYFVRHEACRELDTLVRVWDLGEIAKDVEYTVCQIVPADRTWGVEQFTIGPDDMVKCVRKAIRMVRTGNGIERPSQKIKRLGWNVV